MIDDHRKIREPLAIWLRWQQLNAVTADDAASMWSMVCPSGLPPADPDLHHAIQLSQPFREFRLNPVDDFYPSGMLFSQWRLEPKKRLMVKNSIT